MKIKPENIYKALQILTILVMVCVLVFLTWQKLVPSKTLTYHYELNEQGKFIQGFYPHGRVYLTDEGQIVLGEPVYLNVYYPKKFKKAKVKLIYQNYQELNVKFGLELDVDEWAFYFKDLEKTDFENEYSTSEFEFDLNRAKVLNNKIRFAISSPEMDVIKSQLLIKSIDVRFE